MYNFVNYVPSFFFLSTTVTQHRPESELCCKIKEKLHRATRTLTLQVFYPYNGVYHVPLGRGSMSIAHIVNFSLLSNPPAIRETLCILFVEVLICLDFQRWTRRGQELKDKLNRGREESSEDIDVNPIPTVAGSTARLVGERNIARYSKPSRYEDRVELLSDVDDQHSAPSRYSPTRSDRSVPKNVFDDI